MDNIYIVLFGLFGGHIASLCIYSIPREISLTKLQTSENKFFTTRYLLVSLSCLLVSIILHLKSDNIVDFLLYCFVFYTLISLSFIDIDYKAVPDSLNILAFVFAIFCGDFLLSLQNGLVMAGAFFVIRFVVSYILSKEAMGEADILIAGTIGAVVGIKLGMMAIILATIIALPFSIYYRQKSQEELPFVPFLSIGLFLVFVFDSFFIDLWYKLYGVN